MIAGRLAPGAHWRLATDWADYAEQMIEVLDAEPLLTGGRVERWAEPPGDALRAQGPREGPRDHGPHLHAHLSRQDPGAGRPDIEGGRSPTHLGLLR